MAAAVFNMSCLSSALVATSKGISSSNSVHVGSTARLQCKFSSSRLSVSARPVGVRALKVADELTEIRALSTEDIQEQVIDLKGELFFLRVAKASRKEFKTHDFKRIRRKIARLLTVKREREIEKGIKKRESQKLDREWVASIVPRAPPGYENMKEEEEQK